MLARLDGLAELVMIDDGLRVVLVGRGRVHVDNGGSSTSIRTALGQQPYRPMSRVLRRVVGIFMSEFVGKSTRGRRGALVVGGGAGKS